MLTGSKETKSASASARHAVTGIAKTPGPGSQTEVSSTVRNHLSLYLVLSIYSETKIGAYINCSLI